MEKSTNTKENISPSEIDTNTENEKNKIVQAILENASFDDIKHLLEEGNVPAVPALRLACNNNNVNNNNVELVKLLLSYKAKLGEGDEVCFNYRFLLLSLLYY